MFEWLISIFKKKDVKVFQESNKTSKTDKPIYQPSIVSKNETKYVKVDKSKTEVKTFTDNNPYSITNYSSPLNPIYHTDDTSYDNSSSSSSYSSSYSCDNTSSSSTSSSSSSCSSD